jgi:hypothetical protein
VLDGRCLKPSLYERDIHLDEINLLLLWHNLIHIRLEAGVGLDGLCANGALGRRLDLAFGAGCQTGWSQPLYLVASYQTY